MTATRPAVVPRQTHAFTLVELMVSMVVLALMLVMLEQLTSRTQKTMVSTSGKIEQFREARQAFEAITRRLSQATLNTYWDYYRDPQTGAPLSYVRQSELRFISGRTEALFDGAALPAAANRPTHAVFFQAPVGMVDDSSMLPQGTTPDTSAYHGLNNLLNTWGYCIEYDSDQTTRPAFLDQLNPKPAYRKRFRLIEMQEPTEFFSLYAKETRFIASQGLATTLIPYTAKDWFCDTAITSASTEVLPSYAYPPIGQVGDKNRGAVHVLAENVVALVLLPKLSKADQNASYNTATYTDGSLCPHYLYDSTTFSNASLSSNPLDADSVDPVLNPKNQLPPIVQVTMVAVDEASFGRLQSSAAGDGGADIMTKMNDLFKDVNDTVDPANPGYAQDLQTLQAILQDHHLNYRVFTTEVSLKSAKWSRQKTR